MTLIFKNFFGCIELRTGCAIIGFLNFMGSLSLIIIPHLSVYGRSIGSEKDAMAAILLFDIFLNYAIFLLTIYFVLMDGLLQNFPGNLMAYMIFSALLLTFHAINMVSCVNNPRLCWNTAEIVITQCILTVGIGIYFLLVVRSMYYRMKEQRN